MDPNHEQLGKALELLDILRRQIDSLTDRVMQLEQDRNRHIRLIYDLEHEVEALKTAQPAGSDASESN